MQVLRRTTVRIEKLEYEREFQSESNAFVKYFHKNLLKQLF